MDFRISSSSSESLDEEINVEDHVQATPEGETVSTPKNIVVDLTPPGSPEQQPNQEVEKNKSRDSTSNTRSFAGNYVDQFALLEIRDSISGTMKKVNAIEAFVDGLNTRLDVKVFGLDSKLDAILNSLSTTKPSRPTTAVREAQLDQLISLRLKHTIEEVEKKSDESIDHYLDTITKMLKVHDDRLNASYELIKQTYIHHEKQIQRLEKEIQKKDEMNLIMQQVLIKLLKA